MRWSRRFRWKLISFFRNATATTTTTTTTTKYWRFSHWPSNVINNVTTSPFSSDQFFGIWFSPRRNNGVRLSLRAVHGVQCRQAGWQDFYPNIDVIKYHMLDLCLWPVALLSGSNNFLWRRRTTLSTTSTMRTSHWKLPAKFKTGCIFFSSTNDQQFLLAYNDGSNLLNPSSAICHVRKCMSLVTL